jgi:hypothetical protein
LTLFPEGERYAQTIAAAANDGGVRLIAHVYVRYFGDLSGGLIMKELLIKSLGLNQETLAHDSMTSRTLRISRRSNRHSAAPLIAPRPMMLPRLLTKR